MKSRSHDPYRTPWFRREVAGAPVWMMLGVLALIGAVVVIYLWKY